MRLEPGARFKTRGRTITEADVVSFAALTGDWHPQHADAEWAGRSRFGARIAHGMLVLSYAIGLMPLDPERVVALRGAETVTFKRPAHIGDTIHVEGEVAEVRPLDASTALARIAIRVLNQHGRAVAQARLVALARAEPAEADGGGDAAAGAEPVAGSEPVLL